MGKRLQWREAKEGSTKFEVVQATVYSLDTEISRYNFVNLTTLYFFRGTEFSLRSYKKFPVFYGARSFATDFKTARHFLLS